MAETTFLNEGGILVTNARFAANGQTHAISGVTSVRSTETRSNPSKTGPIIVIVIGVLLLGLYGLGVIPIGLGIWWLVSLKPSFEYTSGLSLHHYITM